MHKIRCGCEPPHPCTRCRERGLTCDWPAEDRRTTRFRDGSTRVPSAAPWAEDTPRMSLEPDTIDPAITQWDTSAHAGDPTVATRVETTTTLDNRWLQTLFGNDMLPAFSIAHCNEPWMQDSGSRALDPAVPNTLADARCEWKLWTRGVRSLPINSRRRGRQGSSVQDDHHKVVAASWSDCLCTRCSTSRQSHFDLA